MNKELQDLAWSVLPKEFKKEVRKEYAKCAAIDIDDNPNLPAYAVESATSRRALLEMLFGEHNLTSDAEGEVELLHVTRQKVMGLYANAKKIHDLYTSATCINTKESQQIDICKGVMSVLDTLYGSKCLPDNVESSRPNVDSSEPKKSRCERCGANTIICAHMNCQDYPPQSEPKYRKGEKVCYNGYVYEIEGLVGKNRYALKGLNFDLDEDMIEPYEHYTEPLPQNPTENCDNESHISTDCDKPAEPKFKIGDKVKDISSPHDDGIYKVDDIKKSSDGFIYHIQGLIGISNVKESDLEPYTEPTKEASLNVNNSDVDIEELVVKGYVPDPAKQFDTILKDGFSKERRLNIAAQIARTLIQGVNFLYSWSDEEIKGVAHNSIRIADTLIAEVEIE